MSAAPRPAPDPAPRRRSYQFSRALVIRLAGKSTSIIFIFYLKWKQEVAVFRYVATAGVSIRFRVRASVWARSRASISSRSMASIRVRVSNRAKSGARV